ncbi:MAG: hypothetical protein WCA08_12135, partial [Desulfoferrobacter sp.]
LYLGVQEAKSDKSIDLIGPCETLEDFQKELAHLIHELNQLSAEARQKIESFDQQRGAGKSVDAAQIWKELEACGTDAEMFEVFNSYGQTQRQEIAEYVFTHVNMFRGRGPVFSEHYDSASHLLE